MPLLILTRFLTSLASLAILAASVYFVWSWWDADFVQDAGGAILAVREDWRLWAGLGLLALSFFGRLAIVPVLARGTKLPVGFSKGPGETFAGARSPELFVETTGPNTAPSTFLLTHGQGMDTTFWSPIRKLLSKHHHVIAWDLSGFGLSKRAPGSSLGLDDAAADLEAVLAKMDQPVIL